MNSLCNYNWPRNIRELMNVIERAILLSKNKEISIIELPKVFHEKYYLSDEMISLDQDTLDSWKSMTLPQVMSEVCGHVEKLYLSMLLSETNGKIAETARKTGIHQRWLSDRMKVLDLRKEDFK